MKRIILIFELIWKSLIRTFNTKVWRFFGASFGGIISLLKFGNDFLNQTIETSIKIGALGLAIIIIPRFLFNLFSSIFRYLHSLYKESKYGDAIIILKDAFSKIHWLRKKDEFSDEELMKTLVYLCDKLQELFKNKNLNNFSVSIKIPTANKMTADASLKNLCRDSEHKSKRDTANYRGIDHTVIGNTAFTKVLSRATRKSKNGYYYFNNDISSTKEYENTSKEAYPEGLLPYESEIVVPIMPSHIGSTENWEILGFLCVDSNKKNIFDEKYDVPLIEGVADGIYDILLSSI